jgi:hypothetical protein
VNRKNPVETAALESRSNPAERRTAAERVKQAVATRTAWSTWRAIEIA